MPASRARIAAVLAAVMVAVPALSASANDATTDVEFELSGQGSTDFAIALDGPAEVTLMENGNAVTGSLPATVVTDKRTSLLGSLVNTWNVRVSTDDHFWRQGDVDGDDNAVRRFAVPRNEAHVYLPTETAVTSLLGSLTVAAAELPVGLNRLGPTNETALDDLPSHSYTLVSGTSLLGLLGGSQHRYTPQMSIDVPDGQVGGTYSGTVTQTLSAGL